MAELQRRAGQREEQAYAQYFEPHSGMHGAGVFWLFRGCRHLLPLAAPCTFMPLANAEWRFSKRNSYFLRFSLIPPTPWRSQSSSRRLCYRCVQRASSTNPPHRRCPPHSSQLPQLMFRRWTLVLLLTITVKTFELLYLYSWQQQQQQQRWRQ